MHHILLYCIWKLETVCVPAPNFSLVFSRVISHVIFDANIALNFVFLYYFVWSKIALLVRIQCLSFFMQWWFPWWNGRWSLKMSTSRVCSGRSMLRRRHRSLTSVLNFLFWSKIAVFYRKLQFLSVQWTICFVYFTLFSGGSLEETEVGRRVVRWKHYIRGGADVGHPQ